MTAHLRETPLLLVLAGPAALVGYLSFNAGGFFPGEIAIGALAAAQVLVLYVMLSRNPLGRLSWPSVAGVVAMALMALWILLSQLWSDSPARSLIEFDRALLYLLVLITCVL